MSEADNVRYRAVAAAVDLEHNFERELTLHGGPLGYVLIQARRAAIGSMAELVEQDPTDAKAVMLLQNEVRRYFDLVGYARKAIDEGREAWTELRDEERRDVAELLAEGETEED